LKNSERILLSKTSAYMEIAIKKDDPDILKEVEKPAAVWYLISGTKD